MGLSFSLRFCRLRHFVMHRGRQGKTFGTPLIAAGVLLSATSCGLPPCNWDAVSEKDARPGELAWEEERWDDVLRVAEDFEETGDPEVLFSLGFLYAAGLGEFATERDRRRRALALMKEAAWCGVMQSKMTLAHMYETGGLGEAKNPERAACLRAISYSRESAAQCGITLEEEDE